MRADFRVWEETSKCYSLQSLREQYPFSERAKKIHYSKDTVYFLNCRALLLLGGFGNLSGAVELWDMGKKKLIASHEASDTTLLHWSPDGEHYMTATTAPRLRIANW